LDNAIGKAFIDCNSLRSSCPAEPLMKSFKAQFAGTFGPHDHLFDCVSASDCLLQTSEDMGRFLYELTPAADAQHCAEGDAESCAWLAASLLPFGPVGKLAKLGKVAKGAEAAIEAEAAGARTFGRFSADDLRTAAQAPDRNGLTQVGRALQKHSGREGSVFSGLSNGNAAARNEQGLRVLDEVLGDTGGRTEVLDRVTNIWDSTGRGVRFSNDGSFMGFLEPVS
jgi:hypothetical protein